MKPDFERIERLLREAVTMLCKNSLPYKHELSVQGLLGITLDKEDIFLVNIKEILKPHEFVPPKIDSDDDDRLVMREGSLSPVDSSHEEPDSYSYRNDSSIKCSTVPTRAVVPIFKGPNKAQHSHKRAAPSNNSELSRHMLASAAHQGSGDSRVAEWDDSTATPPHNKRRNMWSGHRFDSPAIPIDVDRLPTVEIKRESTDENVTPESMTKYQHMVKYQHHQTNDNLSNLNELTNFAAVHMGQEETESKRILPPVSLPSIAGITGPSWHPGDILSTSVSSLPNLSSDMISAGLPSGHLNNSMVSMHYLDSLSRLSVLNGFTGLETNARPLARGELNSVRASGSSDLTSPVGEWIFLIFLIF